MAAAPFDPRSYWDDRHRRTEGLEGVGYLGLGAFNDWMYRVRARVFRRVLAGHVPAIRAARVLDVGSGTGFYLEQWRRVGAREIAGSDLSEVACERLRRAFPGVAIHHLDITDPQPGALEALGRFGFISVIDVLYHVVDDGAYQRALTNLASLLEPGGRLVMTENFLIHHARTGNAWQISRTLHEITGFLEAAGLTVEVRAPWFVLMNNPVDGDSRIHRLFWKGLDRSVRRSRLAGHVLGAGLYPVELALTRLLPESPSSEIAIVRKRAPGG